MKVKIIIMLLFCIFTGSFSSALANENLTQKHREYLSKNALLILNDRDIKQIREQILYYGKKGQESLSQGELETLKTLTTQFNQKIQEMIPRYMNGYRNVPDKFLERAARAEERRKRYQSKYAGRQAEQISRITTPDTAGVEESTKRFQSTLQDDTGGHDIEVQEIPKNTSLYDLLNPTIDNGGEEPAGSGASSNLQKSIPF